MQRSRQERSPRCRSLWTPWWRCRPCDRQMRECSPASRRWSSCRMSRSPWPSGCVRRRPPDKRLESACDTRRGPASRSRAARRRFAFTSQKPPPTSCQDFVMSGVMKSTPVTTSPIAAAARSAAWRLSGWTVCVTSTTVPPVAMLAVPFTRTTRPAAMMLARVQPWWARTSIAVRIQHNGRQCIVGEPVGIAIFDLDELGDRVLAVPLRPRPERDAPHRKAFRRRSGGGSRHRERNSAT